MIGRTISHYKVLEKLGGGGMGVVYKAEDTRLKRPVALKFLSPGALDRAEDTSRFHREAQAAAALHHPNICTIYEIDEANGETFIAMAYIRGRTLKDAIQTGGAMGPGEAVRIAIDVARGLTEAHGRGIVHRDIKSGNIMITETGQAVIMDFGVAKWAGRPDDTKEGIAIGTVSHMSPEQAQGLDVDHRSDLWSLGVVLYEMLTGQLPFRGEHDPAVMYGIVHEDPAPAETLRLDIPRDVASLVSRLLRKDPEERPRSAGEIIAELERTKTALAADAQHPEEIEKSIAVLYFENLSSDKESDYFCAGMTEDIIIDLSKIGLLRVVSRTDVLPFRNKALAVQQIGEALNVNYILEGSMRKAGGKVRINAQLVDARSGYYLWAERFDRRLDNIFDLQNEVSHRIAEALRVTLTATEEAALGKRPTENLEAYDYYLRGKDLAWRRSRRENEQAIEMFREALEIDPDFALAYTGLAECFAYKYQWWEADILVAARAIEASRKAVQLDPGLAEAHFVLGLGLHIQNRYEDAEHEYKVAVSLKPDFYDAYRWLGNAYDVLNRLDDAMECYRKASEIKPFSEEPLVFLEMNRRRKGDVEQSERLKVQTMKVIEKRLEIAPEDTVLLSRAANFYADFGEHEKALQAIESILKIDPDDGLCLYNIACVYGRMGKKKEALRHLKRAYESGWRVREWASNDPDLDILRDEEEFQSLIKKMH